MSIQEILSELKSQEAAGGRGAGGAGDAGGASDISGNSSGNAALWRAALRAIEREKHEALEAQRVVHEAALKGERERLTAQIKANAQVGWTSTHP